MSRSRRCYQLLALAGLLVALTPAARAQTVAAPRPARRVLGVFDVVSGAPIAGAEVTDLLTGTTALTTNTGTVSLAFVDTAGSLIRIRKIGYDAQVLMVANSVRDTVPVTIALAPSAPRLPTVVTRGYANLRGPADTVRKLETHGYYDRRMFSGAPSTAFVTGQKLERLRSLADLPYLTGRPICGGDLYLDGVRYSGRLPAIENVLAVEQYTHVAEFPAEYNSQAAGRTGCLTLIWTK